MQQTENLNIESFDPMPTPEEIHARVPMTEAAEKSVLAGRRAIEAILDRKDPRLFVVVGPCSIHDPVVGLMIESFITAGNQPIPDDLSQLKYGCSVTDACVDWPTTEQMIRETHDILRGPLAGRAERKAV